MLQDARIKVDHVGVGEWIAQQASGCQHAIPGFCYIRQHGWGQLATSLVCCFHLCRSHTDEHCCVVKNRVPSSRCQCLCCEVGKLMNAQHHGFSLQRLVEAGLASVCLHQCTKVTKCRVEDECFLSTNMIHPCCQGQTSHENYC
jgi:hypothetical protein